MKQNFFISLGSLPEGAFEADYDCDNAFFEAMESPGVLGGEVKVHLHGVHKQEAYKMHFTLKGEIQVPCDRCLDPVTLPVDTVLDLTVKYGDEYDDSRDDLLVIPQSEMKLDLGPLLSDTIVLEIPMRTVHAEGECNPEMEALLQDHAVEDLNEEAEEEED